MSDFKEGLDKIWAKSGSYDHKQFTMEIINLHQEEMDKVRNFVPIHEEQINLILRIILFPLILVALLVWSIIFLFSSPLFANILVKTGENFLRKRPVSGTPPQPPTNE